MNDAAILLSKAEKGRRVGADIAPTGDLEGATNRAYYASFHAARAALAHFGELPETVKSHSTVIGLFGKHIVQTGRMDTENGRLLNRAHQLRNLTDYNVGTIDHDRIEVAVIGPESFVSGIQLILRKKR